MKKLVVMGLAMAMTASMVNGVCAQPVQAADGEGLKVALLLSGAEMTRAGIRLHTKEHRKPVRNTDTSWLTQRIWKLLIFPPLMLIMQVQAMMW